MTESQEQLLQDLARRIPALENVLVSHRADNCGEVIPHLLMADVARLVEDSLLSTNPSSDARSILELLDSGFRQGDESVRNLISVSFLENLPEWGREGRKIRSELGPALTAESVRREALSRSDVRWQRSLPEE